MDQDQVQAIFGLASPEYDDCVKRTEELKRAGAHQPARRAGGRNGTQAEPAARRHHLHPHRRGQEGGKGALNNAHILAALTARALGLSPRARWKPTALKP